MLGMKGQIENTGKQNRVYNILNVYLFKVIFFLGMQIYVNN